MAETHADHASGSSKKRDKEDKHTNPILIDLGRQRKRKVKSLRKGKGTLMDDLLDSLHELEEKKQLSAEAQPIIVIVSEKKKKRGRRRNPWW